MRSKVASFRANGTEQCFSTTTVQMQAVQVSSGASLSKTTVGSGSSLK